MAGIVPDVTKMLTWIGLDTIRKRDGVNEDLLSPNGLIHLKNESAQDIISACNSYSKRTAGVRFAISRVQQKGLISLMYWVKDRYRTRELYSFDAGTDEVSFLSEIQDAYDRHDSLESQRTMGMALLGNSFSVQLESRHQWKRWSRELDYKLSFVIGVSGVPLSYVIRDIATPTLLGFRHGKKKLSELLR